MELDPAKINQQTYDRIASQFAEQTVAMPVTVAEAAARLLSRVSPGQLVLDLGCGPGRDKAWLEQRGAKVIGVDQSAGMLDEARKASQAHLCQMEMRQLGFASGLFAGVWCNATLLHLPKREAPKALMEIARVLLPGGCLFLSLQKGAGEGVESGASGKAPRFFARYAAREMAGLLEQAGFSILRQDCHQVENAPERVWLWYETIYTSFERV